MSNKKAFACNQISYTHKNLFKEKFNQRTMIKSVNMSFPFAPYSLRCFFFCLQLCSISKKKITPERTVTMCAHMM